LISYNLQQAGSEIHEMTRILLSVHVLLKIECNLQKNVAPGKRGIKHFDHKNKAALFIRNNMPIKSGLGDYRYLWSN